METKLNMVIPNTTEEQKEAFRIFAQNFPSNSVRDFVQSYKGNFDSHEQFAKYWHETIAPDSQIPVWAEKFVAWESVWKVELKPYYTEINGFYFENEYFLK